MQEPERFRWYPSVTVKCEDCDLPIDRLDDGDYGPARCSCGWTEPRRYILDGDGARLEIVFDFQILRRGSERNRNGWVTNDGQVFTSTDGSQLYKLTPDSLNRLIREAEDSLRGLRRALAANPLCGLAGGKRRFPRLISRRGGPGLPSVREGRDAGQSPASVARLAPAPAQGSQSGAGRATPPTVVGECQNQEAQDWHYPPTPLDQPPAHARCPRTKFRSKITGIFARIVNRPFMVLTTPRNP